MLSQCWWWLWWEEDKTPGDRKARRGLPSTLCGGCECAKGAQPGPQELCPPHGATSSLPGAHTEAAVALPVPSPSSPSPGWHGGLCTPWAGSIRMLPR